MKFVLAAFVLATCFACVLSGAIVATPLKRAFDAAIIEFINSGERTDFQNEFPLGTPLYGNYPDCIPEADEYPYPALQRRGGYSRLIEGIESLRIGSVGGYNTFLGNLTSSLINNINQQYGGNLSPVFYFYPDEDSMFAGLQWRQIDMTAPVFDLGLFFSNNTIPISYWFPHTCSVFAGAPVFVVLANSTFTDAASLNGARICTYFQTWSWFAQPVVPASAPISIDLDCDAGLDSGLYDAVYLVQFSVQTVNPTRTIDSGTIVPAAAFFQNRGPPIDPEPLLPEPFQISFSPQPTPSNSGAPSITGSPSLTSSPSLSGSNGASVSASTSSSASVSASTSSSASGTSAPSASLSSSTSLTPSTSQSGLPTATPSSSTSASLSGSTSFSASATSSVTASLSQTPTSSLSQSASTSITPTISLTQTAAPTSPIVLPSSTNPLGNNG